jgi:IS605 OrfB family transposase
MKLTIAVKIVTTSEQAEALRETLARCNEVSNWIAATGFAAGVFREFDLHYLCYRAAREKFDIGSVALTKCMTKVAGVFSRSRTVAPNFRPLSAHLYTKNMFRIFGDMVSIWTIRGRMKLPIAMGERQRNLLPFAKGEASLAHRQGKWFLILPCEVEAKPARVPSDWLGIDMGIVNIAADSDGTVYSGSEIEARRAHASRRKAGLQRRGTKAAKRRLRKLSGKQRKFQTHTNHCISKALVLAAERTGRGIGLEDLKHIRARVTAMRSQRARLNNWAFGQLREFITYKAKLAGVPVAIVNPKYTSQQCSCCGHIDKANRPDQATFSCVSCGHSDTADLNAARNIRARAALAAPSSSRASA